MKVARAILASAALLAAAIPCRADPPLAGGFLVTTTGGQPFCTTRLQLQRYVLALIQHDRFPPGAFNGCVLAPFGARVAVLEDLTPRGSLMHVVRARASVPLQRVEGYTYSVGLYDSHRYSSQPGIQRSVIPQLFP